MTKPGRYGTLYRYELVYTDESDAGFGEMTTRLWAYSLDSAVESFYESDEGWKLLRIAAVPANGLMHRARWVRA